MIYMIYSEEIFISDVQMSSIHPKLLSSQSSAGSDSSETSPSEDPETDLVSIY